MPERQTTTEPLANASAAQAAVPSPAANRPQSRQIMAEQLLAQAEQALAQGRLTTPAGDNAHDKFRAVLLVDPDNAQAQAGLDAVVLSYADLISDALRNGRPARARVLLTRALAVAPDAPILEQLRGKIAQAEQVAARQREKKIADQGATQVRIDLPTAALNARDETVQALLTEIAKRVENTDEMVMIRARSDAEGRWIYQTMKDALDSGYRIRGDIRIANQPAIELLEPLP